MCRIKTLCDVPILFCTVSFVSLWQIVAHGSGRGMTSPSKQGRRVNITFDLDLILSNRVTLTIRVQVRLG